MSADVLDDLARARAEFSRWRASGSGRGRIPSRLWALAISVSLRLARLDEVRNGLRRAGAR